MARVTLLVTGQPETGQADGRRLQMTVGLTSQGRIDDDALREPGEEPWSVAWTAADGGDHTGELMRIDAGWALREHPLDDAPLWRFEAGTLRPGDIATLREPDGSATEFRVVAVEQD